MPSSPASSMPGARRALALLLGINLFNYIDRYILAAVEPQIRHAFFGAHAADAMGKTGLLASAFLVSYMLCAPLFGWLADRFSRWVLAGCGVALWSLASGGSGLACGFGMLLVTRILLGVGEAGYGPAAPTLLADYFPAALRGRVLALFYLAIPVGSALGYVLGGMAGEAWGWRSPFYLVTLPGLLLGGLCFLMREPGRNSPGRRAAGARLSPGQILHLLRRNPSYLLNTAAMTAMTFSMGGIAFWMPAYLHECRGQADLARVTMVFGAVTVGAGLLATLAGGWLADAWKRRWGGAYFGISGIGMLAGFPLMVGMLYTPFPWFWAVLFAVEFCLFLNTGPANAALAEVTAPSLRATAFAVNIFLIHALGDVLSPPLVGRIADRWQMHTAFLVLSGFMALSGGFWIWGTRFLARDTRAMEAGGA